LVLAPASAQDAHALPRDLQSRIEAAFARGVGHGLLDLGTREVGTALPPQFAYWRDFGAQFVTTLCTSVEPLASGAVTDSSVVTAPTETVLADLVNAAPPMAGCEYLTADVLRALWQQTEAAYRAERALTKQSLQDYLKERNPAWHLIGRVHFNLAENRTDEEAPFAFIATYTTRLSAQAKAQHQPLAEALREYAGAKNRVRLKSKIDHRSDSRFSSSGCPMRENHRVAKSTKRARVLGR
jgi:non-specific serine/threonine protein kinase